MAYNNRPGPEKGADPANYVQGGRNGKPLTNSVLSNTDGDKLETDNMPIYKSQRLNTGPALADKSRIYDSESSQRDMSFLNDLS